MNIPLVFAIILVAALAIILASRIVSSVRASRSSKSVETPTLRLVKRRRELQATLHKIVGCDMEAARIVRNEAERLQVPRSSVEALEAAIRRVEVEQAFNRG